MDAYQILVIILAVLLAIFLTLSIVAAIMVIALVKRIEATVDKAQQAAANVQAITGSLRNVADGSALTSAALAAWNKMSKHKSQKKAATKDE